MSQPDAGLTQRAEPQSFRARVLSVSITATDLEKSLHWYRDIVGFTVQEEWQRDGKLAGVRLVAGDVSLMLGQDDGAQGWQRTKGVGFSLFMTTAQDVDALARRITERGGQLDAEPADMPWGARVFRLHDPDGFKIVIGTER